jgi:DNA-binding transcriptional MerR regulator
VASREGFESLPRYLTVRQLALALHCCPQTVRNWCKRGLLPPPLALSRRKRLWDAEAVVAALEQLQGKPARKGERSLVS